MALRYFIVDDTPARTYIKSMDAVLSALKGKFKAEEHLPIVLIRANTHPYVTAAIKLLADKAEIHAIDTIDDQKDAAKRVTIQKHRSKNQEIVDVFRCDPTWKTFVQANLQMYGAATYIPDNLGAIYVLRELHLPTVDTQSSSHLVSIAISRGNGTKAKSLFLKDAYDPRFAE